MEMQKFISTAYTVDILFYASTLIAHLMKRERFSRLSAMAAIGANAAILAALAFSSHHLPVFSLFEGLLTSILVLGFLGVFCRQKETSRPDVAAWVWIEVLFLFGITLFFQKEASAYRHDSTFLWVLLFHGLREIALGTGLFAVAHFIFFRLKKDRNALDKRILHQGRNFLLLTTVLFLNSEYAGMIWCQKGWGDFWHWNGTFFQSTLIILGLMLAFHIPGNSRRADDIRSLLGSAAVLLMLTVKVGKGLFV